MKMKNARIIAACVIMLIGAMFLTACSGVTISPGENGSVVVTPGADGGNTGNNGNNGTGGNNGSGGNGGNTGGNTPATPGNDGGSTPVHTHNYSSSVVTTNPTCTLSGVRTYRCSCGSTYDAEIQPLGHDYSEWNIITEAECESRGQEQRVCRNDSSHIDTRTVAKLGHDWGEWTVATPSRCDKEGEKKRVCLNDSTHVEFDIIPVGEHSVPNEVGVCAVCGDRLIGRLESPVLSGTSGSTLLWGMVDGADCYEVTIAPNGTTVKVKTNSIDLEEYYGSNSDLQISVRAMAPAGSNIMHSVYANYVFKIPGSPISDTKGIGDAVNLLTGTYTEFAGGTTSIWNENLFARLRTNDKTTVHGYQIAEVVYRETLDGYVNHLTQSFSNKTSVSASVGYAGIAKVTAGFSFEVGETYEKKTQSETQAVFYDMDYKYIDRSVEIYGYNDKGKFTSMLSEEFVGDAAKVQNGEMSAEVFVQKYGTHIVTAGTYGAKFNLHYEMLTTKSLAENTFGQNIETGISAQIQGSVYGVKLGLDVENSATTNYSAFTSNTSSDMSTKFTAKAIGGNATGMMATSLGQFAEICKTWAAGLEESDDYVLVDVPDGSLFFVWDFLGDEYAEAKNILDKYFYACCDENYYALKDKVSSLYQDSFTFDETEGTLTVNLSGLQNYDSSNLSTLEYKMNGASVFSPDTGVFTVFSQYDGNDVEKVVFVGSYYTKDKLGRLITTKFNNFRIKFDAGWDKDIVVEFRNFAFEAPAGKIALSFSDVNSENVTIITNNAAYIKGGDGAGAGQSGCIGVYAPNKNLLFTGNGDLEVRGGNGSNGAKGTNANGGDLGETGHTGGSGGSGGFAINTNTLVFKKGTATIIGGNGGAGGRGGDGDTDDSLFDIGGNGGTGGRGGDGAEAVLGIIELDIAENSKAVLNIRGGDSGSGGSGGSGHGRGLNGDPGSNGANPKLAVAIYTSDKAYEVYDTQKTWSNAKEDAESKGGYLVTITSEEEHEIITKMLEHANSSAYYIGAERVVDVWAWVTGEEFDYAPWNEGQPDDTAGIEDCVEIYVSNSKFNDIAKSNAKGFIIEYDL